VACKTFQNDWHVGFQTCKSLLLSPLLLFFSCPSYSSSSFPHSLLFRLSTVVNVGVVLVIVRQHISVQYTMPPTSAVSNSLVQKLQLSHFFVFSLPTQLLLHLPLKHTWMVRLFSSFVSPFSFLHFIFILNFSLLTPSTLQVLVKVLGCSIEPMSTLWV
jgi:hypothetical protein